MKLNLDLPKYKWQILFDHLKHYRENETVNTFCCVVESLESDKQFPMKMYQFLSSHEDLSPLIFPTVRDIQQKSGGPGIIKFVHFFYFLFLSFSFFSNLLKVISMFHFLTNNQ